MTKVTILGQSEADEPKKKPIKFVKHVCAANLNNAMNKPSDYKNIELIARNVPIGYDCLLAYDDNRNDGSLYLGHFNDGVA